MLPGAPPLGVGRSARVNWLGHALDASKWSQILFMDRDDILNLCVATNLPLPSAAWPGAILFSDEPKADGTMPNRPELPTLAPALSAVAQRAGIPCQEAIRYGICHDNRALSPSMG